MRYEELMFAVVFKNLSAQCSKCVEWNSLNKLFIGFINFVYLLFCYYTLFSLVMVRRKKKIAVFPLT